MNIDINKVYVHHGQMCVEDSLIQSICKKEHLDRLPIHKLTRIQCSLRTQI